MIHDEEEMVKNNFQEEYNEELKQRIRGQEGRKLVMSAREAAELEIFAPIINASKAL